MLSICFQTLHSITRSVFSVLYRVIEKDGLDLKLL